MARTKRKNRELAVQIGNIIRAQRKAAGMTQAVLGETLELETETISRMENGLRLPSIEKLVEMAEVFRIPIALFFKYLDAADPSLHQELYLKRMGVALEKLPETGKTFVLEVAQNYARYHPEDMPKPAAKKSGKKAS